MSSKIKSKLQLYSYKYKFDERNIVIFSILNISSIKVILFSSLIICH